MILRKAVQLTQAVDPNAVGALLAEKMSQYANLLAAQGSIAAALTFLPASTNQVCGLWASCSPLTVNRHTLSKQRSLCSAVFTCKTAFRKTPQCGGQAVDLAELAAWPCSSPSLFLSLILAATVCQQGCHRWYKPGTCVPRYLLLCFLSFSPLPSAVINRQAGLGAMQPEVGSRCRLPNGSKAGPVAAAFLLQERWIPVQ